MLNHGDLVTGVHNLFEFWGLGFRGSFLHCEKINYGGLALRVELRGFVNSRTLSL